MNPRTPPQDLEAERATLGAMLMDSTAIPAAASILQPGDFYREFHRKTFEAILSLWNRGEPVDLITLKTALNARDSSDPIYGELADMTEGAFPPNVKAYAEAVKKASEARKILVAITRAEQEIYSSGDDPLAIASRLGSALSRLQDGDPRGFVHVSALINDTFRKIEEAYERKDPITGIPTGLRDLDLCLGGIHRGDLVLIAGRPSMGKTALAGTIAKGAAQRGYGVAFVTAESPAPKILQRMLASDCGIENRRLRGGKLSEGDLPKLINGAGRLGSLPLWLLDKERSWDRIKTKLRVLKLKEPALALAVIDYVGLLSAPGQKNEPRYLEVARISSDAKGLAMDQEMGVVLLSQLNREIEKEKNKRPRLSDLRESGDLEQDADIVGLLYREAYYNRAFEPKKLAELNIAKNRDGATGKIELAFHEETVSFEDWNDEPPF